MTDVWTNTSADAERLARATSEPDDERPEPSELEMTETERLKWIKRYRARIEASRP